ncbi:DUF6541 family protein [Collinsella sp. An2]|uniref:DUF6541 family protein n=1 Tax=Collinsella sp. An2 TaxID=1965585 RepID=UPI000B369CF3|nr:DUF6541 family protein [Collinsella sp. An2]OUP10065.1 hypothetical protein B5F33_03130 [Collinsella sp. An2]
MWIQFCAAAASLFAAVYIPGLLAAYGFGLRQFSLLALAPACSVAVYCIEGIVLDWMAIRASWFMLVVPYFLLAALLASFRWLHSDKCRGCGHRKESVDTFVGPVILYICFGLLFATTMYLLPLDGPTSSVQTYDNVFHYGLIKSFSDSGSWSIIKTSLYLSEPSSSVPMQDVAYYPAAWHLLCSLAISMADISVGMAANVVNFFFVSVVYPLGMLALIHSMFNGSRSVVLLGSLVTCAFSVFPWMMFDVWPLYPNALSMMLLPGLLHCFIEATSTDGSVVGRVRYALLFVVYCMCQVFAQPNTIFSAAVILAPYCIYRCAEFGASGGGTRCLKMTKAVVMGTGFALFVCVIWIACFRLPFMQPIVRFRWAPIQTLSDSITNIIQLSFVGSIAQPLLSVLVAVGAAYVLFRRQYLWMLGSYIFSAFLYAVSATMPECELRHLLCGFWYTDPYRLAALAGMCAILLAVCGLFCIFSFVMSVVSMYQKAHNLRNLPSLCVTGLVLSCLLLGWYNVKEGLSPLNVMAFNAEQLNSEENLGKPYNSEMAVFMNQVKKMVPEDSLIINAPYDGSLYANGVENVNFYYRSMSGYGSSKEAHSSALIREKLSSYVQDPEVQQTVSDMGASYLLILSRDMDRSTSIFPDFVARQWRGIYSVTDDTPGFTKIAEHGEMRLYKIGQE